VKKYLIYFPIIFSVLFALGVYVGIQLNYANQNIEITNAINNAIPKFQQSGFSKINNLLNYIDQEYVDEIDKEQIVEDVIYKILEELDPHSYYISKNELASYNEPLEGNFEGIGIEFNAQKDTVVVVTVIAGGPSEKVGLAAGDRIIKVNNESIVGKDINTSEIVKKLKGKKGTEVEITVIRKSSKKELIFKIVRGTIPINSIDASYMADKENGYIKISRFSRNTYDEFLEKSVALKKEGMKTLILDLRGNGGGYLDAAVKIADEFLEKNELIVYTEGKSRPKQNFKATSNGNLKELGLIVLIDENSASASEIIAGAIQDNDRGIIIGRRSFGKGLVQEQSMLKDGSALRLTIARYYTPSGRSIQKPYTNGNSEDYHKETYDRYTSGELTGNLQDTTPIADSLKFYTKKGRVVYGGGGIMPDYFIPLDTNIVFTDFYNLLRFGVFNRFTFDYTDNNRQKLKSFQNLTEFNNKFVVDNNMMTQFFEFAKESGFTKSVTEKSELTQIKSRLKAQFARYYFNDNGFFYIVNQDDEAFLKALELSKKEGLISEVSSIKH
jgi:carboxyl-terminal processing protease